MNRTTEDFSAQQTLIQLVDNEKGQSAIEFILVLGFALGITFLFMAQTFNTTKGYLLHYATFTASRVYLTYDDGTQNVSGIYSGAAREAQAQIDSFQLNNLFGISANCNFENFQTTNALFTGAVCEFQTPTNFFPLIGGGDDAKLVSESFLGKEPVRSTCYQATCEAITGNRNTCRSQFENMDITLYDNGC